MGLIVEPLDEIQVWIVGTGMPLWGRIQTTSSEGDIDLVLTVEPLSETLTHTRSIGVVYPDGIVAPVIGKRAHIPKRLVDVVFGDDRHFATHG